jgi:diguanylate cyclase (GGDEF)-like protein
MNMKNMKFEKEPKTVEMLEAELHDRDVQIEALKKEREELTNKLEKAEQDSLTDELTGLYNLRGFKEAAQIVMPGTNKEGHPEQRDGEQKATNIAILHLDIDEFKGINDTYGHPEGDRIIREAAGFLTHFVRQCDVVARTGGDEFVIIMNGDTEKIIDKFFDRNVDPPRSRFGFTTEIDGKVQRVSFSGGITLLQPGETTDNLGDMISRADKALYTSKETGRDRITLFKPETSDTSADLPADEAQE